MTRFGRPALALAVVLMLAPLSREVRNPATGPAGAGAELVRVASLPSRPVRGRSRGGPATPGTGFPRAAAIAAARLAPEVGAAGRSAKPWTCENGRLVRQCLIS
jgi:hypothetical protein